MLEKKLTVFVLVTYATSDPRSGGSSSSRSSSRAANGNTFFTDYVYSIDNRANVPVPGNIVYPDDAPSFSLLLL